VTLRPHPATAEPSWDDVPVVPLSVTDFRDAVVSLPLGAKSPRPVVIALHGNYDRPEWQCDVWRTVTSAFPFILCPRGIPRPDAPPPLDRFTYGKGADVQREIDAALVALEARFGDHIARGPNVYVGFSLGAILGVGIVSRDPSRFPRAVLVEGGHTAWTEERVKAFATSGERVLFACGQRSCKADAAAPVKMLAQASVDVRLVYGDERAHTYDGKVADAVGRQMAWLVEGDPRWASFIP
jgi:pimeloyl-ACP methyl ester carboxylesterase